MNSTCIDISVRRIGSPMTFDIKRMERPLSVGVSRVGEDLVMRVRRIGDVLSYEIQRETKMLDFSVSLVCSVGCYNDGREVFMVKDGIFLLEDGGTFRVIKENGEILSK